MRTTTLLAMALGLAACGPVSVNGQIEGDGVGGARSAFFDETNIDLGPLGDFDFMTIIITDFADGCDVMDDFFDDSFQVCDEVCDDYIDTAEQYRLRKPQYWGLVFNLNTSDGVEGEFDFDEDMGDEEFDVDYLEWDAVPLRDHGDCEDECDDGDLLDPDIETGEDGTVEITKDDGDVIVGRFEAEFDGSDRLKGSFRAEKCNMDGWLF